MTEFAGVLLVDGEGRLLLQERDEHAPIDPEKWGLPGGHLEPGENPRDGAIREVAEETGVRLDPAALTPASRVQVLHRERDSLDWVTVFTTRVDLTDDDVECHEGRRFVFVEAERALGLDLSAAARVVLPDFLVSEQYRGMLG